MDIPVDDTLLVEVLEGKEYLCSIELGTAWSELLALNMQHQVAAANVFHHKVYTRLGLEARVQAEEERMSFASRSEENTLLRFGAVGRDVARSISERAFDSFQGPRTHLSTSSFSMMNSFLSTLMA